MKNSLTFLLAAFMTLSLGAAPKQYNLTSPDGRLEMKINVGEGLSYDVLQDGVLLLENSRMSMTLQDGTIYGAPGQALKRARTRSVDRTVKSPVYKKSEVEEKFNELTLEFKGFKAVFRAYDEGCAYRFISGSEKPFIVSDEQADFRFPEDRTAYIPYVNKKWKGSLQDILVNDFQCPYTCSKLSEWIDRWSIAPILVQCPEGKSVVITEADLMDYPGMFLYNYKKGTGETLSGYFARVPDDVEIGGHNMVQEMVNSRKDYIAECKPGAEFPWRVIAVASSDKELTDSDIVWKLATPADADADWSWVRPGKVAWEWWNAWNIKGVDFEAGVNNDTYKYYIDFAAENRIEYVILDEGWAVKYANDLTQVVPEIDLQELVEYGRKRGVGIILWAGWYPFTKDMENVCRRFSEMGVKGFKVDFMNRDDQKMVEWYRDAAAMCAKYHMLMNFHGAYKPTGLQRTYPNVVNFEGVFGLEQMKWSSTDVDHVTYDVTIPFIRMVAGPMDYTQGAMRNAVKKNYRPIRTEPMSQGTRCHQLAEYVIFESPLNMMCDSPNNYRAEQECTDFISAIPTVWDETIALDGKVAEYVAMARRKDDRWYVGAMTNWDSRALELDLSFLPAGDYTMTIYQDGINAHRIATDYKKVTCSVPASRKVEVKMAPGGGWAAELKPVKPVSREFVLQAHRGIAARYPENTSLSFSKAAEIPVYGGMETDVQMTKDGIIVCMHDKKLDRTTDGTCNDWKGLGLDGPDKVQTYPKWLDNAVIYHIYPSSFKDSDGDGYGDLEGIRSKLDYVKTLGFNTIWISPVFCSMFEDGGYDITDYYKVDPRFGTNTDLENLVKDAHAKGLRICLDLVAGHTSDKHPWFVESANGDRNGHYSDYYIWMDSKDGKPRNSEKKKWVDCNYPRGARYMKNYYDVQPALNYGYLSPDPSRPWEQSYDAPGPKAVRQELKNIIAFWFDKGVDGFRCDLAWSLVKGDDEEFHGVRKLWDEIFTWTSANYPDRIFLSEWSSPVESISCGFDIDIIRHNGCGKTMYRDLVYNTVRAADPETGVYAPYDCWFDKAGKGRISSFVVPFTQMYEKTLGHGFPCMPTSSHDTWRMNRNQRSDPEELKTMMTFFLTMPWVPIVYYGEEIGMRSMDGVPAVEGSRDRSAERTPMQWGAGPTSGFSTCTPEKLYLPIDPSPTRPTVENEINDANSMYSWTKGLLALRASIPALGNTGDWKYASNPNQPYPAVYERSANGEKYLVVINPRAEKAKCTITGYDGMESVIWGAPENISMKSSGQGLVITITGVSSVICKMK